MIRSIFPVAALAIACAITWSIRSDADLLPVSAPIPKDNPIGADKIELGKQLYFDGRLSLSGKISCNSCHDVTKGGEDNLPFSPGHEGKLGGRSSPTVWNAAFYSVLFWDGRAASLEEQAKGPITNPVEMAMPSHDAVVERIRKIPGYVTQFKKVFGGEEPVTIDNIAKAIATYERTLITPNSPYDRYLSGDKTAMSARQIRGRELMQTKGCFACHGGPNFAGPPMPAGMGFYQRFPMFDHADLEKKYGFKKDQGRYEVTKNEHERNFWRVPTLRNIALTAPYFHNGAVKTLEEAVRVMARTQLNHELKDDEVKDIVAFLNALTGERPRQTAPKLPE